MKALRTLSTGCAGGYQISGHMKSDDIKDLKSDDRFILDHRFEDDAVGEEVSRLS